ncbi:TPA: hypothetical protein ACKJ7R_001912, partial [Neisseria gonorrhoeae]
LFCLFIILSNNLNQAFLFPCFKKYLARCEKGVHSATQNYRYSGAMPSERIFRSVLRLVGVSSDTVKRKFAGAGLSYAGKAAGESLYCL